MNNIDRVKALYRASLAAPPPQMTFPDAAAVARRRETCSKCPQLRRDGPSGKLDHCAACRSCSRKIRRIVYTVPLSHFRCPLRKWNA